MSEDELIGRVLAGDATAWQPLVHAHQEAVFRLAYLLLGDAADAEDVAQETMVRAGQALGRFERSLTIAPMAATDCAQPGRQPPAQRTAPACSLATMVDQQAGAA